MRSRSMMLILVSLGFGAVAAVGMVQVMSRTPATATEEKVPVLVATVDLQIKDELSEENVGIEHYPVGLVPDGVISSWEEAQGKRILTRLSRGMPILQAMIRDKHEVNDVEIPPGYKVIAISVDSRDSFYGLLRPGHRVDVIAVLREDAGERARTFLHDVTVYAVDDKTDLIPDENASKERVTTVQLIVTQQQAEQIALYEREGTIRLVLGSQGDGTVATAPRSSPVIKAEPSEPTESRVATVLQNAAMGLLQGWQRSAPTPPALPNNLPPITVPPANSTKHVMEVVTSSGAVLSYEWDNRDSLPRLTTNTPAPSSPPTAQPASATSGGAIPSSVGVSSASSNESAGNAGSSETTFDYEDDGAEKE